MIPLAVKRAAAAELIGVSERTFQAMVDNGEMPRARIVKGMKRWIVSEIEDRLKQAPEEGEISDDEDWSVSNVA